MDDTPRPRCYNHKALALAMITLYTPSMFTAEPENHSPELYYFVNAASDKDEYDRQKIALTGILSTTPMAARAPVATPSIAPQPAKPAHNESPLAMAIGSKIRITSAISALNNIEGTITDLASGILTLSQSGAIPNTNTFKTVAVSEIQSFTITSKASPNEAATAAKLPNTILSPDAAHARLENNLTKAKADEARRGKGVTAEAQKIFDAMSKTLTTRWEGTNIIVADAVIISSPYRVEDCKSTEGGPLTALGRIKQVLGKERQKMASKERGLVVPAVPSAVEPRKGG